MTDTIERFAREYIEYNGLSAKRATDQIKTLRQFEDHAGRPLIECGAQDFRAFIGHLLDQGLHVNTVAKKANMVRPYFGWAFDAELIDGNTLMAVKRVKNPNGATRNSLPRPYSEKELRAFWTALDEAWPWTTDLRLKRWRNGTSPYRSVWRHAMRLQVEAIVRLALDCGLRAQEIYLASIDDLHPDNYYVVVANGKRESAREDKPREVPFTRQARLAVDRWFNFRRELHAPHRFPWLALKPGRIPKTAYGDKAGRLVRVQPMRVERFGVLLRTIGDYQLHRLRHTCGTNWVRAGVDLQLVSRMLGHASLQQTLGYAEIVRDDIHKAMHDHEDIFENLVRRRDD